MIKNDYEIGNVEINISKEIAKKNDDKLITLNDLKNTISKSGSLSSLSNHHMSCYSWSDPIHQGASPGT